MPEPLSAPSMLGAIRAVTCVVPELERITSAYSRFLGYRIVEQGKVPPSVARSWHAPAIADHSYITMEPASAEQVHLRFIENAASAGWRALTTHGWNVSELVVESVDALNEQLADSPFCVIGGPMSLQRFPMIRAMQVLGPAGECLYFTEIGAGSGLDLASAKSFVGRVFIVIAGGPDLDAMFKVYARFANVRDPPVRTRVEVISKANGMPLDTQHAHGLIHLPRGSLIELDAYPDITTPRQARSGDLPPGMAIVSFEFSNLEVFAAQGSPVQALLPGTGRALTFKGAAGELIELVEPAAATM